MAWPPSVTDLTTYSLPASAVAGMDAGVLATILAATAKKVASYLPAQYGGVNGSDPPVEIVRAATHIASPDILTTRGVNPDAPEMIALWRRAEVELKWLVDVRSGKAGLSTEDLTPDIAEGAPEVGYPDAYDGDDEPTERRRGF